ncbi:MAG: hypothetical protein R3F49_18225 [Planctomycetota bacterium]
MSPLQRTSAAAIAGLSALVLASSATPAGPGAAQRPGPPAVQQSDAGFAAPAPRAPAPLNAGSASGLTVWHTERTLGALELVLRECAARAPDAARLIDIGPGREGRRLLGLEIGRRGAPGVVVVPGNVQCSPGELAALGAGGPHASVDATLDLALALLRGLEHDAALRARLEQQRVVLLVGARPDLCGPALAPLPFDVTRNFPVDGDLALQSGGGPYPLAAPGARALAQWLDGERSLFAALIVGAPACAGEVLSIGDTAADAEEARLLSACAARAQAFALSPIGEANSTATEDPGPPAYVPGYGSVSRFARLRLGLAVAAAPLLGDARDVERAGAALYVTLDAEPRLELAAVGRARPVGPDLWQIDLVVQNVGGLGTANPVHVRERRARGVLLTVRDAELVVGAVGSDDGSFEVVEPQRVERGEAAQPVLRLRVGDLAAGAQRDLRLFVRGVAGGALGSMVEVDVAAPRVGGAALRVALAYER